MQIQTQEVTLRKLIAAKGKVIVSKSKDEDGNPVVTAKEIYLADGTSEDDFEEIDEIIDNEE